MAHRFEDSAGETDDPPVSARPTRKRVLTEKGMAYRASVVEGEFLSISNSLSQILDTIEQVVADGGDSARLQALKVEAGVKMGDLSMVKDKLCQLDAPPTVNVEQAYDAISRRCARQLESANQPAASQRFETASNRSSVSSRSSTAQALQLEKAAKLARLQTQRQFREREEALQKQLEELRLEREISATRAEMSAISQMDNVLEAGLGEEVTRSLTRADEPREVAPDDTVPHAVVTSNHNVVKSERPVEDTLHRLADILSSRSDKPRLPTPEPDVFDGDRFAFVLWLQSFEELVEKNVDDKGDCLFHLSRYLSGEPREVVRGLLQLRRPEAYFQAKRMLQERYGDPFETFDAYRKKLYNWPKISASDSAGLRRFADFLQHCVAASTLLPALKSLDDPRENQKLLRKLPGYVSTKWASWVDDWRTRNTMEHSRMYPQFEEFVNFVAKQARIACDPITSVGALRESQEYGGEVTRRMRAASSFMTRAEGVPTTSVSRRAPGDMRPAVESPAVRVAGCGMCGETHWTDKCPRLLSVSVSTRETLIKNKGLCYRCLRPGHRSKECRSPRRCVTCGGPHSSILHRPTNRPREGATTTPANSNVKEPAVASVVTHVVGVTGPEDTVSHSLIVPVWVHHEQDPSNRLLVYAVLDEQSDATFATNQCFEMLNVPCVDVTMRISTMIGDDVVKSRRAKGLVVCSFDSDNFVRLPSVYSRDIIPSKREHIPRRETAQRWTHLQNIAGRLMPYSDAIPVWLLIGADCAAAVRPLDVVSGGWNDPYAVKTTLGWGVVGRVVPGRAGAPHENRSTSCLRTVATCKEIMPQAVCQTQLVKDLKVPYSHDDVAFLRLMTSEARRLENGRYRTPLPLKTSAYCLPDNRSAMLNRLYKLKKRLQSNKEYFERYEHFMREMITNGHAEQVPPEQVDCSNRWYVPHHGINHDGGTRKFRVVFDCSATHQGQSLNQHLMQGPDMTNNLSGLLCRFREEPVAVACDVEKMFFQIEVTPEHRKFIRFLWWKNSDLNTEPTDYQMTVHLFGASSSPSVANFVLKAAATAGANLRNVEAVNFVKENFYVDDGLKSVATVGEAIDLVRESRDLCAQSGFKLHKFVSNVPEVLKAVPGEERAQSVKDLDRATGRVERMLGTQWDVEKDELRFTTRPKVCPLTRRGLLSSIYSVFDPLGLLSPVILIGKKLLQDLCRQGMDWDAPVDEETRSRWLQWRDDLSILDEWKIPRCYKPPGFAASVVREFHHFSDASSSGIGQCTYIRQVNSEGVVTCSLVMAKSRVAPSKVLTVPRLELSAALLSINAAEFIAREMKDSATHFFWTDSKVVLGYLRNDARKFHVFVANRVQQIRNASTPDQWHHVKSESNPADIASRGMGAKQIVEKDLWWKGPTFLRSAYTIDTEEPTEELDPSDPEVKLVTSCATVTKEAFDLDGRLKRFSSWRAAKRAIALCLRVQNRYKGVSQIAPQRNIPSQYVAVEVGEMIGAEREIIRQVQQQYYGDIEQYRRTLPADNSLRRLDPFVGEDGLLRVGGRSKQSTFSFEMTHPVIIPKNSELSRLVIDDCHEAVKHQGRGLTLGECRSKGYWIVQGTAAVSSFIYKCVTCRRLRGRRMQQKMGDLPEDRFVCEPAFTCSGVDCFGPWVIKEGRSEKKRYGVLFTCMSSRAVHIEVAASLTTDSFVNAFRRFVGRRGPVRLLRSDRGTNFIGAFNEMNFEKARGLLSENGCEWKFNPPHASHMGGCWERHIRTVRSIMNTILHQHGRQLNDETLHTFLVEAEAIINNRPLCAEDLGAEIPEPLTPNHLLTGKTRVVLPPPVELLEGDQYARRQWKRVQYVANEFWNRWRKSYFQSLQTRSKWHQTRENVTVGDIVIVMEKESPRNSWMLARVIETYPDSQGLVRKAKLLVGNGHLNHLGRRLKSPTYLERPIHGLVLLVSD